MIERTSHVDSWYAASAHSSPACPRLEGSEQADVCVVGGGLTGLGTALDLAEAGYRVVLLEARRIGWGASGRSGGQMIFGFGCDQSKLANLMGMEASRALWQAGLDGMGLLRARIQRHAIDCDFRPGHAHVAIKPRQMRELEAWQADLEHNYGYSGTELWDRHRIAEEVDSPRYLGALFDPASGHIHPLNYTLGLARAAAEAGVVMYEDSEVIAAKPGAKASERVRVRTASGTVEADYLCLAGNAYLNGVAPPIENHVMPVGTYIGATEVLGEDQCRSLIRNDIAVADINFVLDYFRRSSDHRLLFGGRVSYSTLPPPDLPRRMSSRMLQVFPQLRGTGMDYTWGGFVAITMNRAPHFGRIGSNILFAQGFSGHGIATTGLAGRLMAETIRGQAERFDLFARIPHIPFPGGRLFRTPALVMAMLWFRMRDWLP